jgi:hypothetical protein
MTLIKNSLKSEEQKKFFHDQFQYKPMGKYVHFLTVRITESYALFQTDQELNKAKVRAGIKKENKNAISRLAMFKRKQSSPERLVGRELLRNYGLMTANTTLDLQWITLIASSTALRSGILDLKSLKLSLTQPIPSHSLMIPMRHLPSMPLMKMGL